jgi:hypothetical protein
MTPTSLLHARVFFSHSLPSRKCFVGFVVSVSRLNSVSPGVYRSYDLWLIRIKPTVGNDRSPFSSIDAA